MKCTFELKIENLDFGYGKEHIFRGTSLSVSSNTDERGHIIAVMGSSGSGKSTFLQLLCGLQKPWQGSVAFVPKDPVISYLSQQPVLFSHLSAEENISFFKKIRAQKDHFQEDFLRSAVEVLGLKELLKDPNRDVTGFSGGEQQRLSLARALSIHPDLLLLDEPCTGLDAVVKQDFIARLRMIADEYKLLVFYTTHHAREALLLADDLLYICRPRGNEPATLTYRRVGEFMQSPPTIEIAQMFSLRAANLLPNCRTRDGILFYQTKKIGQCTPTVPDDDNYTLIFDSGALQMRSGSGALPITVKHRSGMHQFAVVEDTGSALILEDANEVQTAYVTIVGYAYLFPNRGPGIRIVLS